MSRKIIGITVGTTLPKPNFKQTDPTKGDYIKNKPDFEGLKNDVEDIKVLVGDTPVTEQINSAIYESIATDEEIIAMLAQEDVLPAVADIDGSILADENENVLIW